MLLLLLLLCFFGHVTNVKAQENLKSYFWGKFHFVLRLLAKGIANHSFSQNTPLTQTLNPLRRAEGYSLTFTVLLYYTPTVASLLQKSPANPLTLC